MRSLSRFAVLGDRAADVRTFAVDHCHLQLGRDVVQVAGLVDLWEACKTRMQVRHKAEAEASASSLPPPVNKTEAQDLRVLFEQMHYKLEDKDPSSQDDGHGSMKSRSISPASCESVVHSSKPVEIQVSLKSQHSLLIHMRKSDTFFPGPLVFVRLRTAVSPKDFHSKVLWSIPKLSENLIPVHSLISLNHAYTLG